MSHFTHMDENGRATMVDVSEKKNSIRSATARSTVILPEEVMEQMMQGDIQTKKGSVIQVAVIAGIMAAKKTGDLIPLCHNIVLNNCAVTMHFNDRNELVIDCTASTDGKTGVEMEALVGASVAALTVYDMCKALSQNIIIRDTMLMEKTGGKHDFKR